MEREENGFEELVAELGGARRPSTIQLFASGLSLRELRVRILNKNEELPLRPHIQRPFNAHVQSSYAQPLEVSGTRSGFPVDFEHTRRKINSRTAPLDIGRRPVLLSG